MFGRRKRKDAPDQRAKAPLSEPIVTAATEPVLPPPEPPAPAPSPEAESESLSQADIRARTLLADSIARMESRLSQPETTPAPVPAPRVLPASGGGAVEALAESVARTASEVARALEQM